MIKNLILVVLFLNLTACGAGSGEGLDNQGLPVKDNPREQPPVQNMDATLASLQQNIFGAICINCHTGSNAPRGLRLDSEENSYAFLVGHAADEVPELMRVDPGNPDASYIVRKLEGAAGIVGGRMPLGGPYLSQTQINSVRDWIANGAPRTGTGIMATKISKLSAQKTTSEISLSLHFSRTIEPDSINENNISVYYTSADSAQRISIPNFGLLIQDQSLDIFLHQQIAGAQKFGILIHTTNDLPILDSEQNDVELSQEKIQGGDYHYEYSLP